MARKLLLLMMLIPLGACCTIGPNDHPGGVVNYFRECYAFMQD